MRGREGREEEMLREKEGLFKEQEEEGRREKNE